MVAAMDALCPLLFAGLGGIGDRGSQKDIKGGGALTSPPLLTESGATVTAVCLGCL